MFDRMRTQFRMLSAYLLVGLVLLGGLGLVWLREPIRVRWWEGRLRHANSAAERQYYVHLLSAGGRQALAAAHSLLEDSNPAMRLLGVEILTRISGESARELLRSVVRESGSDASRAAAVGLAMRRDPTALPHLERIVAKASEHDALAAVSAYAYFECQIVAEELCTIARTHDSAAVRAQAIEQLGYKRCHTAIPVLIEALVDDESYHGSTMLDDMDEVAAALLSARQNRRSESTIETRRFATVSDVAAFALRLLSGRAFGFDSADAPAHRRAAQKAWEDWWAGERPD